MFRINTPDIACTFLSISIVFPKKVFIMSKSWGILSEKIFTDDGNYLINHSSSIILLKDGKYLNRISHHADYEDIFKNINKF